MASKEYEVAFKIAGKLSAGFSQAFKQAGSSVNAMQSDLAKLNQRAGQTDKLIKMKNELTESAKAAKAAMYKHKQLKSEYEASQDTVQRLGQEHAAAKKQLAQMERAAAKSGNTTEAMVQEYMEAAAKVERLSKELKQAETDTAGLERKMVQAKAAVDKAKTAVDKKKQSLKKYEDSVGDAAADLETLTKRQKELEEATDKARKSLEKQQKINEKLEKASALQEKSKSVASVGNAPIAAVGGAAVGAGAYMLKMGTEYTQALNQMQAQTGATKAEMEKLGAAAREIYKSGMGESFNQVTEAMANIQQASGLTGKQLQTATSNALLLGDTFGFDVSESTRAASALMKNFGIDAEKAYGLMAYGAQNGANKNGDLLDTLNEYSVHYKALGFDADQFTQHLIAGAESGAFSVDKVGDAVKEFTIRSKDGSKASMEAFEQLGIDGEKATKMFAAGGEQAQKAFFQTVEALEAMKDPVAKNAAGVALFGTQFEDLEAGTLKTFASLKGASVDAEGTLKKINEVRYNDLGSALTAVSRKFSDSLIPASEGAAQTLSASMPQVEAAIAKVQPIIANVAQKFAESMPSIIEAVGVLASKALSFANVISNNWGWIGPIVNGALTAFLGFKALAYIVSPLMTLYKGFLNVQKAINLAKNSTVLHTIATKAHTAATKAANFAQKAWNTALSTAKLVANKVALVAHKAVLLAWKGVCALAAGAQKAFTATFSAAKIVAQKAALVAHKVAMIAWSAACKAAAIAQKALSAAISFLSSPIGIAIVAITALVAAGVWLYKNWDKVKAKCVELWAAFAEKFPGMAGYVKQCYENIKPIIDGLKRLFGGVIDFVAGVFTGNWSRAWEGVKNIFGGVWDSLKGLAKAPLNAVISLVNNAIGALNKVNVKIPDWVPVMGGKSYGINIPKIPMLAEGGIVTKPTVAMVGEGRESEAVMPLSKLDSLISPNVSAAGSITVNFSPVINVNGGGGNIQEDVSRALKESQRDLKRELERLMAQKQRLSYA